MAHPVYIRYGCRGSLLLMMIMIFVGSSIKGGILSRILQPSIDVVCGGLETKSPYRRVTHTSSKLIRIINRQNMARVYRRNVCYCADFGLMPYHKASIASLRWRCQSFGQRRREVMAESRRHNSAYRQPMPSLCHVSET